MEILFNYTNLARQNIEVNLENKLLFSFDEFTPEEIKIPVQKVINTFLINFESVSLGDYRTLFCSGYFYTYLLLLLSSKRYSNSSTETAKLNFLDFLIENKEDISVVSNEYYENWKEIRANVINKHSKKYNELPNALKDDIQNFVSQLFMVYKIIRNDTSLTRSIDDSKAISHHMGYGIQILNIFN